MILNIYAVRDNAVAAFLQPFFSPTNASAIRALTEAVNDTSSQFHKHSADYALWTIGTFDDSTGLLTVNSPERLISCIDLLKQN